MAGTLAYYLWIQPQQAAEQQRKVCSGYLLNTNLSKRAQHCPGPLNFVLLRSQAICHGLRSSIWRSGKNGLEPRASKTSTGFGQSQVSKVTILVVPLAQLEAVDLAFVAPAVVYNSQSFDSVRADPQVTGLMKAHRRPEDGK